MKKKILFVNGHLNVGGVEKSLIDILKNINYEKYDVDLLLFEDLGDYYKELPKQVNLIFKNVKSTYGSTVECLKKAIKNKDKFTFICKLAFMLSSKLSQKYLSLVKGFLDLERRYDCAIAFRPGFCAEMVANCVHSEKKVCWWHHGECNYDEKTKIRMNQTFRMFDKVVSVSDGCKLMIEEYFEGLNGKVIVIPNMIDIKSIKDKSELFNPYENDKDKIKLVTVGRLSKEKHIDNVVHISKELMKNTKPNFIWYIVGDGQEYQNINDLINEFGLENRIKLLGSKENPYPYILYSDILVHTSLVESQCITVLEGLTLNKPCVVTKSIGPSEFIVNKENGILTSDQPNEMADAILKLVNDNDFRKSIIEKSGNVIEERYIPEIVLEKIYRLIEGE